MVSIIVPVYKVETYLERCIESILRQSYRDFELILIDDGSPDRSGEICDKAARKDSRIKVIHQENKGQASARNKGLSIASGEYISFVDSDDIISPVMIEKLVDMLKHYKCDIAICGHRVSYEYKYEHDDNNAKRYPVQQLDRQELWNEVFGNLNNAVWNKIFRRELLEGIKFPTEFVHGEDLLFNLYYLTRCNKGVITKTPYYTYIKRPDSVTTSHFSTKKFTEISSKDKALEIVEMYEPEQVPNAVKYCFRARMNVIRGIIESRNEQQYERELNSYREYVKKNYKKVYKSLKIKERFEYQLLVKEFGLYKWIVNTVWTNRR